VNQTLYFKGFQPQNGRGLVYTPGCYRDSVDPDRCLTLWPF